LIIDWDMLQMFAIGLAAGWLLRMLWERRRDRR
jgi:hypothetical protein